MESYPAFFDAPIAGIAATLGTGFVQWKLSRKVVHFGGSAAPSFPAPEPSSRLSELRTASPR